MTTKNAINQRVERLALDQINGLPYVQVVDASRVQYLVDNFDAPKLGKPIVSLRDGVYYLVDGYHRMAALRKLAVQHSMFWVVEGFTPDEETKLMNERKHGNKKSDKSGGNSMSANNPAVNTPATSVNGAALTAPNNGATNNAPATSDTANNAPAIDGGAAEKEPKIPNQKFRLLAINKLVETDYQRATSDKQVNEIVGAFDEDRLDPLCVAEFGDTYHIIDGLHRSRVMKLMGYTHVYARVLSGLTYEQAAELFRTQNEGKRQISTFDEFRAGIFAKNPMCLSIQKIVDANKFYIGRSSKNFFCIESVKALTTIAKVYGYGVLDDTLFLLAATWSGIDKASQRDYLMGVAEFVKRYGIADFSDRLKEKFHAIQYEYVEAIHAAAMAGVSIPGGNRQKFCQILVKHYNKGLGSNSKKRLVWEGVVNED